RRQELHRRSGDQRPTLKGRPTGIKDRREAQTVGTCMKLCSSAIRLSVLVLYVLLTLYAGASSAQEKKNLRVVFTGLAWNSELPFRVAFARGFFKAQGLEVQPIFVRGGPVPLPRFPPAKSILPRSAGPKPSCAAGPAG